ncbi:MAG: gamma-glutamyltransferase [Rhodospirillaceae bacterium]|nr:gamma-glutamyltransferase [Rhodospirillaceae bacterium]
MAVPFLAACGVQVSPETAPPGNRGFSGVIVSDEPRATLAGRDMMLAGGNAADAAAAVGLSLSVTLPSRAGLGGGGVCTVYDPKARKTEVLDFNQNTPRAFAALLARYGARGWSNAVASAETLARFGFPVSKTLAADLAAHGSVLMGDQAALTAFMDRRRQFVGAGVEVRLPLMAETLQTLRTQSAGSIGTAAPAWRAAVQADHAGVALDGAGEPENASVAADAATIFAVGDKNGMAVACVMSMGAPFGTGRTGPGTGYLLAEARPLTMLPVIGFDAPRTTVVFIGAAHGPAAKALVEKTVSAWVVDNVAYDDVRAAVQGLSPNGENGAMTAAVCRDGLSILGLGCRTLADPKGSGLGLTFGPDTPR